MVVRGRRASGVQRSRNGVRNPEFGLIWLRRGWVARAGVIVGSLALLALYIVPLASALFMPLPGAGSTFHPLTIPSIRFPSL